jgi:hypothetical protein
MTNGELTLRSFALLVANELARHGLTAKVSALKGKPPRVHVWPADAGMLPDMHTIDVAALTHAEIRRVVSEAVNRFPGRNGDPL